MTRIKKYFFIGFIAIIIVVEIAARIFGFGETVLVRLHDRIEYVLVENQNVKRFGNRIIINSLGHRSAEISPVKKENEKRVLLVGDSVVYGNHHVDQSETIAHYMTQSLNGDNASDQYSVISAAASSWGPENMLEYLKERGIYQSDLVFLVLSTHDIFDFPTFDDAVIPYRVHKNVAATDYLIYAIYNRIRPWLKSKISSSDTRMNVDEARDKAKSIINDIIELVQNQNKKIILVFHPTERESQNDFLDVGFFLSIANENNIEFINLQKKYKNYNNFNSDKVHYDGMHLTPGGANLVAEVFKEKTMAKFELNMTESKN